MSIWYTYENRMDTRGRTKRDAVLKREVRNLKNKLQDNLSYQLVKIDNIEQQVSIINTDNLNEKYIFSLPGEDIKHGGLVYWMDNYWLIAEKDANATINIRAKMIQCNYLLKWVIDNNTVCEQWCIIEDGTKYLTGEYEDRNFVVTRGDSRIAMTIARTEHTVKFNRESRFIIDDPDSGCKLSYLLTKPLKLGGSFNNNGVFKFVLQEVTTTDDDNQELCIADYYKYFPRKKTEGVRRRVPINKDEIAPHESGKKVWI